MTEPFPPLTESEVVAREVKRLRGIEERLEKFCSVKYEKVPPVPETVAAFGESFLKGVEFGIDTIKGYLYFHVLGREGKSLDEIKAARAALGAEGEKA